MGSKIFGGLFETGRCHSFLATHPTCMTGFDAEIFCFNLEVEMCNE